jgi:hypothetical protein
MRPVCGLPVPCGGWLRSTEGRSCRSRQPG